MLVALPLRPVEHVVVVGNLREVKVRELRVYFGYRATAVAHVLPPTLPALLPHEHAGGGEAELLPREGVGAAALIVHERGLAGHPTALEDVTGGLESTRQGTYDDEVEVGERTTLGGTGGQVRTETLGLVDTLKEARCGRVV